MFLLFKYKKIIFWSIGLIVVFIAAWYLYQNTLAPSQGGLRIDNTAIIIQEVNKIAQLFTANYYDEIALDTFKFQERSLPALVWRNIVSPRPGISQMRPSDAIQKIEFVVIARGNIRAGYDFSKLQADDLHIQNSAIYMRLPEAEIIEVIINPSDYEVFIEEGRWTLEEAVALKQRAAGIMQTRAIDRGILEQSEKSAINILSNYFLSLGFEEVHIITGQADFEDDFQWIPDPSLE